MTLERALEKLAEANTLNAELLEALEGFCQSGPLEGDDGVDVFARARAAIAKARGTG